jgi:hypothetical protein
LAERDRGAHGCDQREQHKHQPLHLQRLGQHDLAFQARALGFHDFRTEERLLRLRVQDSCPLSAGLPLGATVEG